MQKRLHPQEHTIESVNAGKKMKFDIAAKIYVGGISLDTREKDLHDYFGLLGEITELRIIRHHDTQVSKGFAFITYINAATAISARR